METKIADKSTAAGRSAATDVATKCRNAEELSTRGEYEAAREALGELWPGLNKPPQSEGLALSDQADVHRRLGELSGYLGSSWQVRAAHASAQDLIPRSIG